MGFWIFFFFFFLPLVLPGPGPRPHHAVQDCAAHDCSTLKILAQILLKLGKMEVKQCAGLLLLTQLQ